MNAINFRIGIGWDVHAFDEGRPLILAGVQIPYEQGLKGHSDADVLLHALTDSLLGAAGMPDIGNLFPDTDPAYAGADSMLLLKDVYLRIQNEGFELVNSDIVILAQAPKMAPYRDEMILSIVNALSLTQGQINIKASTTEKLGFIGRKEGIACEAVSLLWKR